MTDARSILHDIIPDGATVFKTPESLARHLRPILARKQTNPNAKRALADLDAVCVRALGPGVGEGNPDAAARVLLGWACETGHNSKSPLRFCYGLAIWAP